MHIRKNLKNQQGFTLIELLVVISIIMVLVAIVIPKFIDSTAVARTVRVQADLISLNSAIRIFATNNNGIVPTYTKDALGPLLTSGELPIAPDGNYKIGGTIINITAPIYSINSEDQASVNINGTDYTADTLKQ